MFDSVKNRDWTTLLANVAVFVGLVFVAIELRQNTNVARVEAYRENEELFSDWRETMMTNPALEQAFIVYVGQKEGVLNDEERRLVQYALFNLFGGYQSAYFAYRHGVIGDAEWQRFQTGACMHYELAKKNRIDLLFVTEAFKVFLDEACP